MVASSVPVFASRSIVTVPLLFVNLPRQIERPPKWSALEARRRVHRIELIRDSAAIALNEMAAASAPAAQQSCFFK